MKKLHGGLIIAELMEITPQIARKWLDITGNANFRSPSDPHVRLLARQIKAGDWHVNGESIKLNCDGRVLDGIHRLSAVIVADVSIKTLVVTGVEDESGIDEGRKRTPGQWLQYHGYANANVLAASLALVEAIKTNRQSLAGGRNPQMRLTAEEVLRLADRYPGIGKYIKRSHGARHIVEQSLVAPVCYLGTDESVRDDAVIKEGSAAATFVDGLVSGSNLRQDDPRHVIRERCIRDRNSRTMKLSRNAKRAFVVRGWNKHVLGQPMSTRGYTFRDTDVFPRIVVEVIK